MLFLSLDFKVLKGGLRMFEDRIATEENIWT
jgi:hypothetical protein